VLKGELAFLQLPIYFSQAVHGFRGSRFKGSTRLLVPEKAGLIERETVKNRITNIAVVIIYSKFDC
jgi:hypothetical protein